VLVEENTYRTRVRYGIQQSEDSGDRRSHQPGKNIDMLIQCLPGVGRDDLYLLIIGEGSRSADIDYLTSVKGLTGKLGLQQRVFLPRMA